MLDSSSNGEDKSIEDIIGDNQVRSSIGAVLLYPAHASAFLLPAGKVLELMAKENARHHGLVVTQTAVYYDPSFPGGKILVPSRLYLKAPNKMRIESDFPGGSFVVIASGETALTLVANRALEKNPTAIQDEMAFRDILLLSSVKDLEAFLRLRGIEPIASRLTVLDRRLAYTIGRDVEKSEGPLLWVDKDLFSPLRLRGREGARLFEIKLVGYKSFEGGPLYPDSVEFYDDGKRVVEFKTLAVSPSHSLPDFLFDIDLVRRSSLGMEKGEEPFKNLK